MSKFEISNVYTIRMQRYWNFRVFVTPVFLCQDQNFAKNSSGTFINFPCLVLFYIFHVLFLNSFSLISRKLYFNNDKKNLFMFTLLLNYCYIAFHGWKCYRVNHIMWQLSNRLEVVFNIWYNFQHSFYRKNYRILTCCLSFLCFQYQNENFLNEKF